MRTGDWRACRVRRAAAIAALGLVGALSGCKRDGVTHVRVPKETAESMAGMGGMGGGGMPGGPAGGGGMGGNGQVPPPPPVDAANALQWTLPAGWTAKQETGMRYATLTPPQAGGKVEVSVITLPGPAGGELANVNRWRGQLGLTPVDEAGLAAMRKPMKTAAGSLGLFDFQSDGTPKSRMVAALLTTAGGDTWFLKMTGEASVVETHLKDYGSLLAGLRMGGPAAPATPPAAPATGTEAPAAPAGKGVAP